MHWFKSSSTFVGGVDFAYLWRCIRMGLLVNRVFLTAPLVLLSPSEAKSAHTEKSLRFFNQTCHFNFL